MKEEEEYINIYVDISVQCVWLVVGLFSHFGFYNVNYVLCAVLCIYSIGSLTLTHKNGHTQEHMCVPFTQIVLYLVLRFNVFVSYFWQLIYTSSSSSSFGRLYERTFILFSLFVFVFSWISAAAAAPPHKYKSNWLNLWLIQWEHTLNPIWFNWPLSFCCFYVLVYVLYDLFFHLIDQSIRFTAHTVPDILWFAKLYFI